MRRYPPNTRGIGNTSWGNRRDRATQTRFRRQVLANAGNQCQWINPDGTRCPIRAPLQAHHDGHNGLALCPTHHKILDPYAR